MAARFGPGGNCEGFYGAGNKSTAQIFKWLNEHGLELYEYQGGKGLRVSAATLNSFAAEAKNYNITVSVHAPYYIAISSEDEEKRGNSVKYILQSLKFAAELSANKIVVHAGGLGKMTRGEAMDVSKRTLADAAMAAYENKLEHIRIGIETMGKENMLGSVEEIIELCNVDKIFTPVIDFGHLYARSLGRDMVSVDDYLRVFERIGINNPHCHFSKIEYTAKGEKKHLTFADEGFGPDYETFLKAVVKAGVSPDVICESAGTMTADAVLMRGYYGKL